MDVDHDAVAADLRASMVSHQAARVARRHHRVRQRGRGPLTDAAGLRLSALRRDPERTSPAWQDEQDKSPTGKDTHTEMVAFYIAQGVWRG